MDPRSDNVDKRLQGHNGRLEKLEQKIGKLEMRRKIMSDNKDQMDGVLDKMNKKLQDHNDRLDGVETSIDFLDEVRMDKIEEKMGKLEMRSKEDNGWLGRQEKRIERIETTTMEHKDRLPWMQGADKVCESRLTHMGERIKELEDKLNEVSRIVGGDYDEAKRIQWRGRFDESIDEDDEDDELGTTPRLEKLQLHMNIMAKNIEAMGKRMEEIHDANQVNFDLMAKVYKDLLPKGKEL